MDLAEWVERLCLVILLVILGLALFALTTLAAIPINLTWEDTSDNETGFVLEQCLGGPDCKDGYWWQFPIVPANATSFTDYDDIEGRMVCYRIAAFNDIGQSDWSNVSCIVSIYAPTNLTTAP